MTYGPVSKKHLSFYVEFQHFDEITIGMHDLTIQWLQCTCNAFVPNSQGSKEKSSCIKRELI